MFVEYITYNLCTLYVILYVVYRSRQSLPPSLLMGLFRPWGAGCVHPYALRARAVPMHLSSFIAEPSRSHSNRHPPSPHSPSPTPENPPGFRQSTNQSAYRTASQPVNQSSNRSTSTGGMWLILSVLHWRECPWRPYADTWLAGDAAHHSLCRDTAAWYAHAFHQIVPSYFKRSDRMSRKGGVSWKV